ncbi:MAG: hypothetical protein DWQ31_16870 [Planctomycetota bacterium]|nr:MAG: hypothetical protein DWQ31_16870 [Planctomycetota bacterium]REJ92027.1 MAG: hypothetical protein DWQ35_12820 [Planctomycetota bacterium]REK28563.1 MAG: hypothetical protein DWQ42_04410 [Planctomycetota bacterium]REK39178.1 MAG: hypothetical protein DWQ46_17995 [Planctomycetota bacterium]
MKLFTISVLSLGLLLSLGCVDNAPTKSPASLPLPSRLRKDDAMRDEKPRSPFRLLEGWPTLEKPRRDRTA